MIEESIRSIATRSRPTWGALLVALVLLALSSVPAEATTTFTVNESGDSADSDITDARCDTDPATTGKQCTLRAAIEEANDASGADTIAFDIGGTGASKTISPASELPAITEAVTIDGYTQPGASPNTLEGGDDAVLNVQLDGLNTGANANGLLIKSPDCTIKGLVIKRFENNGVEIYTGETGSTIEGDFIGVSRDGSTDRGNSTGVYVEGGSNTVGGTSPESRNVISGNETDGIFNLGTENRVEGNFIGTTADGTGGLGNAIDGVAVYGGNSNAIGGTTAGARNVISGNGRNGVVVSISSLSIGGTLIEGNYVGTTADGTGDLGNNEDGLAVFGGSQLTGIGEAIDDGAGNIIAHNGGDGVSISKDDTTGTYVLSNRIFDNGGLGINLLGGTEKTSGVTANDAGDGDTGPNNLQNFPVITSVEEDTPSPGQTTISGTLDSSSPLDFAVQCFLTSKAPASKHGEGERLLATALSTPSSSGGTETFSCVSSYSRLGKAEGQTVTATATNNATDDTSEFSKNKAVPYSP